MTTGPAIGIDLNGLLDAAAFDLGDTEILGGEIPSVIVASVNGSGTVHLTAGKEAALAFEGRGWNWPPEAQIDQASLSHRIPVADIIGHLKEKEDFTVKGHTVHPGDMMAAAMEALALARGSVDDKPVIIAIPDDGRFTEEAQHDLLDAARPTGLNTHLLWRSIATLLGMSQQLNPIAERLNGKKVAVISLLEDGISVNKITITTAENAQNEPYIVPKRHEAGRFFPFHQSLLDVAFKEAKKVAENINANPWQILWGDGLPLRWLLRSPDRDAIFQTENGWAKVSGKAPEDLDGVDVTDENLDQIDEFISDIQYLIYEGPALESPTQGTRLVYRVSEYLREGRFKEKYDQRRQTLSFLEAQAHNAARGCVEFGRRRLAGEKTYLDHLPQLELAVRKEEEAIFLNLNPADAECMGGEPYNAIVPLEFSIPAGAAALNFYLLRDGAIAPRSASENLRSPPSQAILIQVRVNQVPAQGRAQLTLEARDPSIRFPAIKVNWDRMEVLEGETKEDVIERLEEEDVKVPPVQPHPCHSFLWTYKPQGQLLAFSLKDKVESLADCIEGNSNDLSDEKIKDARLLLARYQSPSALTGGWGNDRHPEKRRCRPVCSDGGLPAPDKDLPEKTLGDFDTVLEYFSELITDENLDQGIRNQIVTFCTWAFLRCPETIRDNLREAAEHMTVQSLKNDFYAMGRSFSEEKEIKAFFALLLEHSEEGNRRFKVYHTNALFYLLSLREEAPKFLTNEQAREFSKKVANLLENYTQQRNYKGGMKTALRALGGLLRYRLVDRQFLSETEYLGDRILKALRLIIDRSDGDPTRKAAGQLARDVLTVFEERGVPNTILQWD
jgi:hypothetical protein